MEKHNTDQEISQQPHSQRATSKKIRKAPDGAKASRSTLALERVPKIEILTEPEDISEKNLKGRAGRYYKDGQTLFINGLYPAAERMAVELEPEFRGQCEGELLRSTLMKVSRRLMAFRVGKVTCYAISKRLSEDWTDNDLDSATTPESLSMAADDYKQSLAAAKRLVKEGLKRADVPEQAIV